VQDTGGDDLGYPVGMVIDNELRQFVQSRRPGLHHEQHFGVLDDLTLPGVDGRDPGHDGHARRQFVGHQPTGDLFGHLVVRCRGEDHRVHCRITFIT